MFKNTSNIPNDVHTIVEKEMVNIFFVALLSIEYANWGAALSQAEGIKIFNEIEKMFGDAEASIQSISREWPNGKSAIKSLTNISSILKAWLSNFREWQKLVKGYSGDQIGLGEVKNKYQPFVVKNREYLTQLEKEFSETKPDLSKLNIDFSSIVSQSNEKISKSKIVNEARSRAEAIFNDIWRSGLISQDQATKKLAEYMGLSPYNINMNRLDLGQCGLVLSWGKITKFKLGI